MARVSKFRCRSLMRSGAALCVAALILTSCGVARDSSSVSRSNATPIATASLNPSSICGPDEGDYVNQSFNGDFTGCFRVPALKSSSLIVALQTYLSGTTGPTGSPTTSVAPSAPKDDHLTLSLSAKTVTPGETVVVTGHLSQPLSVKQPLPNLCWDGCSALQEEGSTVHWTSSKTFRINFRVPDTAWIVRSADSVSVHPLTSGTYEVGMQCLTSISGCALGPAEAQVAVRLKAPKPTRCLSGQRCETMSLSTVTAKIGDEIFIKGWAPLQTIIGRPFNYNLSVTSGSAKRKYLPLAFAPNLKGGGFNVVLTPTALRVVPGPTWSSLGRIHYASSTFSGPSAINPVSGSTHIGWCQPSGIVITGGPTRLDVPTGGVRAALKGSILQVFSKPPLSPQCFEVQLDPGHPHSIYAGFGTAEGNSIPPEYLVPLYTTNDGATWHVVPTPAGTSIADFAGFTTEGNEVAALFFGPAGSSNPAAPLGTNDGLAPAEVTSNGGVSWTSTTLGCPPSGPCVRFGPFQWGNCNMSNDMQALLLGPVGASATSGIKWGSSTWVTSVNTCYSQQLVVSSAKDLFLVDSSSQYQLLQSTNSGVTWSYRSLPTIAAANYGPDSAPTSNDLVLAPDGSLFAVITSPSQLVQKLFRLKPFATSWCQIPHAFGASIATSGMVGTLQVNGTDLIWSQSPYPGNGRTDSSMHVVPFSRLSC